MKSPRGFATFPVVLSLVAIVALVGAAAYVWMNQSSESTPQSIVEKDQKLVPPTEPISVPATEPTTGRGSDPEETISVSGMKDDGFGSVRFSVPTSWRVTQQIDGCVKVINPADVGNLKGGDGTWAQVCKKETSLYSERGYWGDVVYYSFDPTTRSWLYSRDATNADDPGGGPDTATTTATAIAYTLTKEPVFAGTSSHSFVSFVIPIGPTTFVTVQDMRWGSDWDENSFIRRFINTFYSTDKPFTATKADTERIITTLQAAIAKYTQ